MAGPIDYEDRSLAGGYETADEGADLTRDYRPPHRPRKTDPMIQMVVERVHDSCPPPPPSVSDIDTCPRCAGSGATARAFETYTAIIRVGEFACWVCEGTGLATKEQVDAWIADLRSKQQGR